ncbi:kielin/chordin-like protein [Argiope bruennichi]|uniref:kielin/chordin-like protein n=1 Tax=Argiope bruennichi TaxID=94029 RepID=UPI00249584CF|nr:kielin/chordin-like protein [Argiope bruennichi]
MIYFAALLIIGFIVEFSPVDAQVTQCGGYCNTAKGCIWVSGTPCATCECPSENLPDVGNNCSPPKCQAGCKIVNNANGCPSCECPPPTVLNRRRRHAQCSMPKCSSSCKMMYSHGSCPYCDCQDSSSPQIQCSPPKCDGPGCYIDDSAKPCPSCVCSKQPSTVQCGQVRCDNGCHIDYSTEPCPSCVCGNNPSPVQCGPVRCGDGCNVDYSTQPCPSCQCNNGSPSQGSGSMASASANTNRGYYGR